MDVITIEVQATGNLCHLVHDGRFALVVDPPRDPSAVERAAVAAGVEIAAVADTHIHHDYVSGALLLSRRHGADYLLAEQERVHFERVGVRHGDHVPVGELDVEVIATPGHTRHHQAFLARRPGTGEPGALFSGGSLLRDAVGRTDLVDRRLTRQLALAQWASVRSLGTLDPRTRLHPTHGFGSFCAAPRSSSPGVGVVTIGDQLVSHPVLSSAPHHKETFVSQLSDDTGPVPAYYARMTPLNRRGAGGARPARAATAEDVSDAVLSGAWVIDVRDREAFAAGHVPGSVGMEYSARFATYAGWLLPWGDDIVLLADSPVVLEPALRDLAAIGIDDAAAHVLADDPALTASLRREDWAGYRLAEAADRPRVVVDVRQRDEWKEGHLPGALHLPLQEVPRLGATLPIGELWVYCGSGYRAGIAASLLHRMGRDVVHIDDSWDGARELAITTSTAA